jgi:outer membrane protein TolC
MNLQLALDSLRNHIGWKETELSIEGSIGELVPENITLETAVTEGLENRKELQIVGLSKDMMEINYKNESLYFLPSIQASAGYSHYAGSQSYSLGSDDVGDTYNWGIALKMPLFSGLSNHYQKRKAHYQFKNAVIEESSLRDNLKLEITSAHKTYNTSLEKLNSQLKNVNLAEKGLRIATTRYANNLGTQLEVNDAQLTWKSVKLSYLNALYQVNINWLTLKKAMGRQL